MALAKGVSILLFVLFFGEIKAAPADTLIVIFDRQNFVRGDSIEIEIYTEPYQSIAPAQTLHLWIDNVKTGQRWKYRYPFLKGRYKIALKINDRIPNGVYAFNFLLQNQFLTIKGKLINATDQDTAVNFMATSKNKIPIIDGANLQPGGYFTINNLYFTDSVFFGFSPVQQKKENNLHIVIETPADSLFIPEAMLTEFIHVGSTDIAGTDSGNIKTDYSFGFKDNNDKKLLQEVVVKTKVKKAIEEYSEKYVGGLFANEDTRTLDFLESDEAMSYPDLFTYLTIKFPNLTQKISAENGQQFLTHRNETVDIYVDEFLDTDFSLSSVSLQDIAMVKFFPQSFRLGGGINDNGLGGSIAIYTKQPQDRKGNKLSNYSFYIKGYTAKNAEWK
jgi:hypothetical protein